MIQDGRCGVALMGDGVEVLERVNDHAQCADECTKQGDVSIGLQEWWRSDERKVSMNAASHVQSAYGPDPSREDALESTTIQGWIVLYRLHSLV